MAIASDASRIVSIFGDSGAKLIKKWETTAFPCDKNFGAVQRTGDIVATKMATKTGGGDKMA